MRILHSSDWHLGQHFMGKSRETEHRAFLDWLLEQIEIYRVDALIVAGDIFDTGSPPSYARSLYNQFIVQMQATGCQFVILGGNHDSVSVLHESRELLACLGTQVIGGALENSADQVLQLNKRDGQPGAVLCAIPFLRPRDLLESQAGQSGDDKQQQLLQAMQQHYNTVFEQADQLRCSLAVEVGLPVIATGHLTTVGGKSSDSVRDIYIGTLDAFPVSAFPAADYIALGHLHRAQKVGGHEHIRYSGSPIPLSFDEANSRKEVLLVEFNGAELTSVVPLEVPVSQRLAVIKGSLQQLPAALEAVINSPRGESETQSNTDNTDGLHQAGLFDDQMGFGFDEPEPQLALEPSAELTDESPIWLEVEIQTDDYLNDLQARVEAIVADKPVEVLRVRRARKQTANQLSAVKKETLAELSVPEVFERRLSDEELDEIMQQRLTETFLQVVEELQSPPESDSVNSVSDKATGEVSSEVAAQTAEAAL